MCSLSLAITLVETHEIVIFYGIASDILFLRSSYTFTVRTLSTELIGMIETADLNDDGLIDLVVLNRGLPTNSDFSPLWIFFHSGEIFPFRTTTTIYLPLYNSIVFGDFDDTGQQNDIAIGTDQPQVFTFTSVNYNDSMPLWSEVCFMYREAQSLIKGRFNDDQLEDLAAISSATNTLQILLGNRDGGYVRQSYLTTTSPTSLTRINFNNDGIDDLAVLSCNGTVIIFLGNSNGIFNQNYLSFDTYQGNLNQCTFSLKTADVNDDGRDDLVFLHAETQSIHILLSNDCNA